jgi:hypothetical protein
MRRREDRPTSDTGPRAVFDLAKPASDQEQRAIIERATAVLHADSRVLAAWLAGSYARGNADVYSDVDVHCLVTDDSADWFRDHWARIAGDIMPVLMHQSIPGVAGGLALSPAWQHLDLIFTALSDFRSEALTDFTPLFDREGRLPESVPAQANVRAASLTREQIDLYFYIIGNLVVTLGRGEYLVALSGVTAVRDSFLVPVMVETAGIGRSGGAKRLNPFLGHNHRQFLEELPPVSADPESICAVISLMAREYARLAKPLAARSGIEWPTALERATADHLRAHTGIEIL